MKLDCAIRVRNRNQPAIRICRSTDDQRVFLLESYMYFPGKTVYMYILESIEHTLWCVYSYTKGYINCTKHMLRIYTCMSSTHHMWICACMHLLYSVYVYNIYIYTHAMCDRSQNNLTLGTKEKNNSRAVTTDREIRIRYLPQPDMDIEDDERSVKSPDEAELCWVAGEIRSTKCQQASTAGPGRQNWCFEHRWASSWWWWWWWWRW